VSLFGGSRENGDLQFDPEILGLNLDSAHVRHDSNFVTFLG